MYQIIETMCISTSRATQITRPVKVQPSILDWTVAATIGTRVMISLDSAVLGYPWILQC